MVAGQGQSLGEVELRLDENGRIDRGRLCGRGPEGLAIGPFDENPILTLGGEGNAGLRSMIDCSPIPTKATEVPGWTMLAAEPIRQISPHRV